MTQQELDHEVAQATGESEAAIRRLGFGLADPEEVHFDPEPYQRWPQLVDWDRVQTDRNVALVEQTTRRQYRACY